MLQLLRVTLSTDVLKQIRREEKNNATKGESMFQELFSVQAKGKDTSSFGSVP